VGKRSRTKGAAAERAVARILQIIYPDAQRRVSGEEGQGENLGRDIKGTPGLCVQVKEMGTPRPLAALDEAIVAAGDSGEIPVAFIRQSRMGKSTPFRVVLTLPHFLKLLRYYKCTAEPTAESNVEVSCHLRRLAEADAGMKARIIG
jgi:hypothetical protein